jgi:membrane fusion protein, heavy metal efflux system
MKPIIIVLSLLMIISCKNQDSKTKADAAPVETKVESDIVTLTAEQVSNAGIVLATPESKEMNAILKVNGSIDVPPQNIISVSVPLGGYLKATSLIPGTKVGRGSVLATMEDQQYIQLQQDYLTSKSRLDYLTVDYNRQKTLNETKAASDKVFQQAKTEYETQKILVKSLAEKLRLLGVSPDKLTEDNISRSIQILSPINGYVSKVNVNIGKYVNSSDVLFELINPQDLHVRLTVFENDASKIEEGQVVLFTTNKNPGKKYEAEVHLITPNIGEDRSTDVHCHMKGAAKELLPGTFVNAEVHLSRAKVIAIPEESVVKWQGKNFVFTELSTNNYRLLPVETGISDNGFVEVKSDLKGAKIVSKNAYTLLGKLKNSE